MTHELEEYKALLFGGESIKWILPSASGTRRKQWFDENIKINKLASCSLVWVMTVMKKKTRLRIMFLPWSQSGFALPSAPSQCL